MRRERAARRRDSERRRSSWRAWHWRPAARWPRCRCRRAPGRSPTLPAPHQTLIPTVNIAPAQRLGARREADGRRPGCTSLPFASGLDHPRWLYVLPNGDVLVAETNAPPQARRRQGHQGLGHGLVMKRAGAGTPSANRITLLRDADGDGVAEMRTVLLEGPEFAFRHGAGGRRRSTSPTPTRCCVSRTPPATRASRRRPQGDGTAGRADQPPLDQEHHRQPGRPQAVRDRRLQQQRGRARHGGRSRPRRDLGSRSRDRRAPHLRHRPAQPQRHGLGAGEPAPTVDRGERTRRDRQRPGARLPDARCAKAPSTAGRTATTASTSTSA